MLAIGPFQESQYPIESVVEVGIAAQLHRKAAVLVA
jgi:hypothetical protein